MILRQEYINEEEKFLADVLSRAYPTLDFGPGSNYRDLIIKPLAAIFSVFRMYVVQSNQIANLLNYDANSFNGDINKAIAATLRNWLLSPMSGSKAYGFIKMQLSSMQDLAIQPGSVFSKGGLRYVLNSTSEVIIYSGDLEAIYDDNGNIFTYITPPIPIIATGAGAAYNLKDGSEMDTWPRNISPNIVKVKVFGDMISGVDAETPTQAAARLEDALIARNMISARSIITALRAAVPDLLDVVPIGFKDPELSRNKIYLFNTYYRVGGCDDVYVFRPPVLKSAEGLVGQTIDFQDGSNLHKFIVFNDILSVPAGLDKAYVKVNLPSSDIYVKSNYPNLYIIQDFTYIDSTKELVLRVEPGCPEERVFNNPGEITVGNNDNYNNIIADKSAHITSTVSLPNTVVLDYPVLWIDSVQVHDPDDVAHADPLSGYVTLQPSVNPNDPRTYRISIPDPEKFNSYGNKMLLYLYKDNGSSYSGMKYRINYYTYDWDTVYASMEQPLGIDRLLRSKYMVKMSLFAQFTARSGAKVDIGTVKNNIANAINSFDFKNNILSCDYIKSFLFNAGADLVTNISLEYSIFSKTGKVTSFTTEDVVKFDADHLPQTPGNDLSNVDGITLRLCQFYITPNDIYLVQI